MCEILLENQADVDHADKEGKSALFAAASMGHLDIVNLLLFWGRAATQHLTLDTNLRGVSQYPDKATSRAFSLFLLKQKLREDTVQLRREGCKQL